MESFKSLLPAISDSCVQRPKPYSVPSNKYKMEFLVKTTNSFKPFIIFAKRSILDV